MGKRGWHGVAVVVSTVGMLAGVAVGPAGRATADPSPGAPTLPVFTPAPSDWSPHTEVWPFSTFTYQLTPEMIAGMSDSCQWVAAQFDPLNGQINDLNRALADQHEVFSGVQGQANTVLANIDQSTAFLSPRVSLLTIRNNPDNFGPYSPIYGGEQMTGLFFQLTKIADALRKKTASGFWVANAQSLGGWGAALRNSGACT